jgi:solute carrier family 25 protein 33/36
MTLDHASAPQRLHGDTAQLQQTLLPTSRELGGVVPPKRGDGALAATHGATEAKSWAHLIAGGCAA